MREWFASIGILLIVGVARGATVETVDDVTLTGDVIAFDGANLTVNVTDKGSSHPQTLAVEDLNRIVFKEVATPKPPEPPADSNQPARPAPVRHLRRVPAPVTAQGPASAPVATTEPTKHPASNEAASDSTWRIKLNNGDALHGIVASWNDQQLVVRPDAAPKLNIAIAPASIEVLWHGDAVLQAKAESLGVPAGSDDVAFVHKEKDNDIVAVHGTALKFDGDSLLFRYDGDDRKIGLSRLAGLTFAQRKTVADDTFHECIRMSDGEQISGQWKSVEKNAIVVNTGVVNAGSSDVAVPLASVASIEFRNGRLTYLSDLTPAKVEQTPYFDRLIPYRTNTSLAGGPLKLSDGTYTKGLAVHSRCVLEYDAGSQFSRFRTKLGFEPGSAMGRAAVRVLGDGKTLFENPDAKAEDKPVVIDVDLTGVSRLTLEVDFGQGQDVGDRVVWADARLLKAKLRKT